MAAAAPKDKVLVFGSNASGAPGSVKALLTKITGINSKHGPFSCVICLGDMFPADEDDTDEDVAALLDGSLAVPCSTYCMLGSRALPKRIAAKTEASHGEICENLFFLGKQTVLTLSSGLKIAAFGGAFDLDSFTASSVPSASPSFTSASLDAFVSNPSLSNTDILLTHTWPSQITRFSEKPIPQIVSNGGEQDDSADSASWGIPALHKIFAKAKPKYAFVGDKNVFWEREPFVYPATHTYVEDAPSSQSATRFISLGQFNNPSKQRQFYAFSVAPASSSTTTDLPANVTPCPFQLQQGGPSGSKGPNKRSLPEDDFDDGGGNSYIFAGTDRSSSDSRKRRNGEPPQGYKCKICNVPGHFVQDCPEKVDQPGAPKKGPNGAPPPETYVCRLCNVSGHWIQDCPLSGQQSGESKPRAGGPPKEIAPDECWFCLSNPKVTKHLIASIGAETYLTLPKGQLLDTSDSQSLVPGGGHVLIIPIAHYPTLSSVPEEMAGPLQAEIDAYKRALRSCYEQYGAKMISWEISRTAGAKSAHAHIQVCPLPPAAAERAHQVFEEEGAKANYDFTTDPSQVSRALQSGNYFRLDLPDGTKMVHVIRPGDRFNLQFGRTTIAQLLDRPARADWKACAKPDEEEGEDKKLFVKAFSKYDPSG